MGRVRANTTAPMTARPGRADRRRRERHAAVDRLALEWSPDAARNRLPAFLFRRCTGDDDASCRVTQAVARSATCASHEATALTSQSSAGDRPRSPGTEPTDGCSVSSTRPSGQHLTRHDRPGNLTGTPRGGRIARRGDRSGEGRGTDAGLGAASGVRPVRMRGRGSDDACGGSGAGAVTCGTRSRERRRRPRAARRRTCSRSASARSRSTRRRSTAALDARRRRACARAARARRRSR